MQLSSNAGAPGEGNEAPSIRATACVAGVAFERDLDLDAALDRIRDPETAVWIDASSPDADALERLRDELGVHPLAIEDFDVEERRTIVRELRDQIHARVPFASLGPDDDPIELVSIDLVIGRSFVLTVHRGAAPFLAEALRRWPAGGALLREGVGYLAYVVLDVLVDSYLPVVERLGERLESLETRMFGRVDEAAIEELVSIKRGLLTLRRALLPLREVLVPLLERRGGEFGAATQAYVADLAEHLRRVGQLIDAERDTVASTLDAWLTLGSHRLNEAMRRLTAISAITGVVASVFGAWGMNVVGVPFRENPFSFVAIVAATIGVSLLGLRIAIARRWL